MKKLERYLGEKYSDSCQQAIITETPSTFPEPDIPTIPDLVIEHPKTDAEINYIERKNIDEAIHKNLSKKDFYESNMQNIYNIIVGQMNYHSQERSELEATFQAVDTD